jgi:hypothetical protein
MNGPALPFASDACYDALAQPVSFAGCVPFDS